MSPRKTMNRKPIKAALKQNQNAAHRRAQRHTKPTAENTPVKRSISPHKDNAQIKPSSIGAEAVATSKNPRTVRPGTKLAIIIDQLRQPGGTTLQALSEVTGWQRHSVRGALSGTLHAKMGLNVQSQRREDGIRTYRIVEP